MRYAPAPVRADPMDDAATRADFYIAEACNRVNAAFEAISQAELAGERVEEERQELHILANGIAQRLGDAGA